VTGDRRDAVEAWHTVGRALRLAEPDRTDAVRGTYRGHGVRIEHAEEHLGVHVTVWATASDEERTPPLHLATVTVRLGEEGEIDTGTETGAVVAAFPRLAERAAQLGVVCPGRVRPTLTRTDGAVAGTLPYAHADVGRIRELVDLLAELVEVQRSLEARTALAVARSAAHPKVNALIAMALLVGLAAMLLVLLLV
jgi:hypothetical protein